MLISSLVRRVPPPPPPTSTFLRADTAYTAGRFCVHVRIHDTVVQTAHTTPAGREECLYSNVPSVFCCHLLASVPSYYLPGPRLRAALFLPIIIPYRPSLAMTKSFIRSVPYAYTVGNTRESAPLLLATPDRRYVREFARWIVIERVVPAKRPVAPDPVFHGSTFFPFLKRKNGTSYLPPEPCALFSRSLAALVLM